MEATRRWLAGAGGEIRIGDERRGGLVAGSGLANAVAGRREGPTSDSGYWLCLDYPQRGRPFPSPPLPYPTLPGYPTTIHPLGLG